MTLTGTEILECMFLQQQQHHLWTCFSSSHARVSSYAIRPCASATSTNFDQNTQNGGEMQQDAAVSGLSFEMLKPVQSFPWHRVSRRLAERLVQSLWTVGKWIMIPVLLLSVLNEVSYTLMQEKLLLIPISMIGGIMFVGILNEVFADISGDVEVDVHSLILLFSASAVNLWAGKENQM